MVEQRYGFSRLLFLGTGLTDYLDVIARSSWEEKVVEAGTYALEHMISWTVADLQQVRPDAAAWKMFQQWSGPKSAVPQDSYPLVEAKSWEALLTSRSRNLRSTARRSVRQAEKDGVSTHVADASDTKRAARTLVALHRESWQGRNIGPEHLSQRFESVIVAAVRRMTLEGIGGVSEFWRDGEVIISDFFIYGPDYVGTYVLGASQEAMKRYQWSSLYIWDVANVARKAEKDYLDLLRGEEAYKLRWSYRVVSTHRLILSQKPPRGVLYGGYHVLRARTKRYTRSDKAPAWLKAAAAKLREIRYEVNRYVKSV